MNRITMQVVIEVDPEDYSDSKSDIEQIESDIEEGVDSIANCISATVIGFEKDVS